MKTLKLTLFAALLAAVPAFPATITYNVVLNGTSESPGNASAGTGIGTVIVDNVANTMALDITFSGLTGTVSASHIHCCTAVAGTGTSGVATTTPTFAGFPSGVTAGSYSNTLDLTLSSSWNPAFVTAHGGTTAGAESFLLGGIAAGQAYWNIHTSTFAAGEIRGFLVAATPEPTTFVLGGASLLALAFSRRRKA
jgi:hypothetical protein